MALIELQIGAARFCEFVKGEINSRPLPYDNMTVLTWLHALSPLPGPAFAVDRIECSGCTVNASASAGGVLTLTADIDVHYITTRDALFGVGSMQPPPTATISFSTPLTITLTVEADGPQLQWNASQLGQSGVFDFSLPEGLTPAATAVIAGGDLVAVRVATAASDPVVALPLTDRRAGQDWNLLISGQIFTEVMIDRLNTQLDAAISPDLAMAKRPRGNWDALLRQAVAWAEMTAIDQAPPLNVDVPVDLTLTCRLSLNGVYLTTTPTLDWDTETTWVDVIGTLLFVPLKWVIEDIKDKKASKKVFALAQTPQDYVKVGQTKNSITYEKTIELAPPGPRFFVTNSAVTMLGVELAGSLNPRPGLAGLTGAVTEPAWGFVMSCSPEGAGVAWYPGQIALQAVNGTAPPTLFPQLTEFTPGGAWGLGYDGAAHASNELKLVLTDPPGGRLAVGTRTKVILFTDCGVRWADLGVIPADELSTNTVLLNSMKRVAHERCAAISIPWGRHIDTTTIVEWMVDPLLDPDPDRIKEVAPLRLWTMVIPTLSPTARLHFFGLTGGAERPLGVLAERKSAVVQIVTGADELLAVRASEEVAVDGVTISQAWLAPLTVTSGAGLHPVAFDTDRNTIELASSRDTEDLSSMELSTNGIHQFTIRTGDRHDDGAPTWATALRLDRQTVAVSHRDQIVVASKSPTLRVR